MHKKMKKILASILAFAMVLSTLGTSAVSLNAAENDDNYTVTLAKCQNGRIELQNDNVEDLSSGDQLSVKLIPDEGYLPSKFIVLKTDSDDILISKETSDDIFTFTMPQTDITIEAEFALPYVSEEEEQAFLSAVQTYATGNRYDTQSNGSTGYKWVRGSESSSSSQSIVIYTVTGSDTGETDAYCAQLHHGFTNGEKTEYDMLGWTFSSSGASDGHTSAEVTVTQEMIDRVALGFAYLDTLTGYSSALIRSMKQVYEWRIINNDGTGGSIVLTDACGISASDQISIYNAARDYADTNASRYNCWARVYSDGSSQDLAQYFYEPASGYLKLTKSSDNTSMTNNNECYDLADANYIVYTDSGCTTQAQDVNGAGAVLTTDSEGNSNTLEMSVGDYYVKESKAPEGYGKDDSKYPVTIVSGETVTVNNGKVEDPAINDPLGITIYKLDAETGEIAQGDASLAGAEFTIKYFDSYISEDEAKTATPTRTWVLQTVQASDGTYMAGFNLSDSLVTDKSDELYYAGTGVTLPLGTYTIEETSAPTGYLLKGSFTDQDQKETVNAGETYYTQYKDEDDNGVWLYGSNTYTGTDTVIRGGVKVQKRDAQSGRDDPQGGASFAGIEITITNDNRSAVAVDGANYEPGQIVYTMYTDEQGYAETANDLLPYGDYIITEINVPTDVINDNDGYLLGNGSHDSVTTTITLDLEIRENGVVVDKTEEGESLTDLVKRGDITLVKHNAATQASMSVPFRLTSETTGESHIFWTDQNGDYSSDSTWAAHSYKTDLGEDYSDGLWFYGYADEEESGVEVDDELGALPFDTYLLEELPCDANEGMQLLTEEVYITQDTRVVNLGEYDNEGNPQAKFITSASNPNLNDLQYVCADNHAVIKDEITYEGLDEDKTYTYVMKLWDNTISDFVKDPETGSDLQLVSEMTPNGMSEGTYTMELLFDATGLEAHTVTVFQYLYDEDGALLVVEDDEANVDEQIYFPYLHTELTTEAGYHMALADGEITFADMVWYENFPENVEVTIVGYLYYYDEESESHVGDIVIDATGKEVIGTRTFWNDASSGEIEVDFKFDDSLLEGREIVASEHAFVNGVRIGYELDATDYAEMMLFPHLSTTAIDSNTEDHIALADDQVVIVDHVTYDHVYPGQPLRLETTIMNAETGEALTDKNGNPITVEKEFTPTDSSGTVDVTFMLDASEYAGTTTVVFESLYADHELVGQHADLTDQGQTVYLPNVTTAAMSNLTESQTALPVQDLEVTDIVTYDHLIPNTDYTLVSYLLDANTGDNILNNVGDPIKEIRAIHTDESGEGEESIVMTFDAAGLNGDTIVITCYLYLGAKDGAIVSNVEANDNVSESDESETTNNDEIFDEIEADVLDSEAVAEDVTDDEVDDNNIADTTVEAVEPNKDSDDFLVAVHDDLDDTYEWILFRAPIIETEALDDTTGTHEAYALAEEAITDTVHYEDLEPGLDYVITGYPVDKETGSAIAAETNVEFTAAESEGDVELHVMLDLSDYAGKDIVFFETLYYKTPDDNIDNAELATHQDINDAGQTISVITPPTDVVVTSTVNPKTGIGVGIGIAACMVIVGGIGIGCYIRRRRTVK